MTYGDRVGLLSFLSMLFILVTGAFGDLTSGRSFEGNSHEVNGAQVAASPSTELLRIEADPGDGFFYPYYLRIPVGVRDSTARRKVLTLFVIPNNTGKTDDDLAVHDLAARKMAENSRWFATNPGLIILVPVFPRPKTDSLIYTHALDRDTMLTPKKEYQRLDLQLIAMIDHARKKLAREGLPVEKRVLMAGFSASGMFVNRFVMLHPELVKAAAVGSPGGWPMAPVNTWKGRSLRYPIGTADLKAVAGTSLRRNELKRVPIFFFLGSEDNNDSVVFRDSFEKEDEDLIFTLFGKTLQERWTVAQSIYTANGYYRAIFKIYPGIGHTLTNQIAKDITEFFSRELPSR